MQVFTHPRGAGSPIRSSNTVPRGGDGLIAIHHRIIAVGSHTSLVELLDAGYVTELQQVLGSGACKFRLLGTVLLREPSGGGEVAVTGLAFTTGGTLVVAADTATGSGECACVGAFPRPGPMPP